MEGVMLITFSAIGLTFEADVRLSGGYAGSYWEPPEPPYMEIRSLTCQGMDASFLVDSDLCDKLDEAAYEAAMQMDKHFASDIEEERAAQRAFYREEEFV
jgi:hypothetical protein